jgi:branched-subunit amino acid transport protein
MHSIYIYILAMALATYVVRVLPLTLIRKDIKNKYIKSFLYYVPYVTLSVMTFPAIIFATQSVWSGIIALAVAVGLAWIGKNMFQVAVYSCIVVYVVELLGTKLF